jgi:hypothetical protein
MTVSATWQKVQALRASREAASPLPFDWFVLALTLLYAISAVDHDEDRIVPVQRA